MPEPSVLSVVEQAAEVAYERWRSDGGYTNARPWAEMSGRGREYWTRDAIALDAAGLLRVDAEALADITTEAERWARQRTTAEYSTDYIAGHLAGLEWAEERLRGEGAAGAVPGST
jgi:hypothetical protein